MKLVISSGHGKIVRGAIGYIDEVNEARRVVNKVGEILTNMGIGVEVFHDNTSQSQSENLETIVNFHNSKNRDVDVSVHFNAYTDTDDPMGCEVLYQTQGELAEEVCDAIVEAGGFVDRGPKKRTDLYFLNNTEMPSILIETCFVDSSADVELYNNHFDDICQAIAETLGGVPISEKPEMPPITEGENPRVAINSTVIGDVTIFVNNQLIRGDKKGKNVVDLRVILEEGATLTVNGQDFHNAPEIPPNQCNIIATVFGGESDYNVSAYDENKVLNDTDLYVALPDRFEGERPLVKVYNRDKGVAFVAEIWDVGPWNTDDPYWDTDTRPAAESGTDEKGRTTNGAGIDLSPALAEKLGVSGKGTVDWEFYEE